MLLVGLGIVAVMIYPGPRDIADWMGNSCANTRGGPGEQCSIWDVLSFLWVAPVLILVGAVMAAALRPEGKGPVTIDLSGRRR
jgi:hypothetical protein